VDIGFPSGRDGQVIRKAGHGRKTGHQGGELEYRAIRAYYLLHG
jgi:hypothetical protein